MVRVSRVRGVQDESGSVLRKDNGSGSRSGVRPVPRDRFEPLGDPRSEVGPASTSHRVVPGPSFECLILKYGLRFPFSEIIK